MRIVKYYHRFYQKFLYSKNPYSLYYIKKKLSVQVDLSCLVSTIRWYHEMENGTEILIKVELVKIPGQHFRLNSVVAE